MPPNGLWRRQDHRVGVQLLDTHDAVRRHPRSAIVGEVFGTAGGGCSEGQYRVGARWEPSSTFVGAATWWHGFEGGVSAGAEVGLMIFTPRFLCFKGCEADDDS